MITRIAGALAALCFLASSLFGQVDARIVGSVVDPTGAAVPNATVSLLLSGGTAARYTTQTSSAGEFTIPSINPGSYSLVVEAKGFVKQIVNGLELSTGRTAEFNNLKLDVATVEQTVEVTAATDAVQLTNSEVSTTITNTFNH